MNWNLKSSAVWEWGNLSTVCPNATESFMSGSLPKPRDAGVGATGHGSVSYSDATFTSSSELGHGSSKSSISASTDSPFKEGIAFEFNFTAVSGESGRVEDSGTSEPSTIAVCHGEPLINLKLGKRAYSENVCEEEDAKNCATIGTTSASTIVKKTKVSQKSKRNSYCEVEGCNVDLSSAKDYYRKHRVCEAHSKSPKVVVAGLERRFCQQCSRLHGLAEFDQNKRSCRRRLSHHNARRRKPETDAISYGSSRLSTMLYNNPRQQTNYFFNEPPFIQVSGNVVSSCNNLEGFRFTKTRFPLVKPTKMDLDGLMSVKGTNIKVFNEGVEASAITSKLNGAPVTGRALSLLSDDSWASSPAVIQQSSSHMHAGVSVTPPLVAANPVMHGLDSTTGGFWQDAPPLDEPSRFQAFAHL